MDKITKLKRLIKDKEIYLLAQGKSIEELENKIERFRNSKSVWMSFSNFDIVEDFILKKINKKLDIVFNAAIQEEQVERKIRIPNLIKILDRGGLVITADRYMQFIKGLGINALENRKNNIILVKEIHKNNKTPYDINCQTNNSLSLMISCLIALECFRIVLFGCDGGLKVRAGEETINSYYKPEIMKFRKTRWVLHHDTKMLIKGFGCGYESCKQIFGISRLPEIINCSPDSDYECFKTISYDYLK